MQKILFLFFILLLPSFAMACECPSLPSISVENCGNYEIIFEGVVDSVTTCNEENALAYFSILNAFKGSFRSTTPVYFECGTSCEIDFQKGDTCLIYAEKNNAQEIIVDFCSRSRKKAKQNENDAYLYNSVQTYQEELSLLQEWFNSNTEEPKGIGARRYQKVDPSLIPVFLIVSVIFMALGLWFFRKK